MPDIAAADLVVRGARTHNLKNIDVTLPVGKLIIITAVGGADAPEVDELAEVGDGEETGDKAPAAGPTKSDHTASIAAAIASLRKKGFARLMIDGRAVAFDDVDVASLADRSMLQVVVD